MRESGVDRGRGSAAATVAGGPRSRERLGRLLGLSVLASRGIRTAAVGWAVDHAEVEVELPAGDRVVLVIDRPRPGRPALVDCGELSVGYRGQRIDPRLEAAIGRVAPRALARATLADIEALIRADPRCGEPGQPLPSASDGGERRFAEQSLLGSWGAPEVWSRFLAVAEISRAQLDSLDTFNRSVFVQHCEAECLMVAPQTGVPMVPLALYPWDDRVRRIDWGGPGERREPDPGAGRLLTTDLGERDVVLGRGLARLDRALSHLGRLDLSATSMVFCSSTCLPVVAGDDVEAVVDRHRALLPVPLMHLTTTPHSMQSLLRALLVDRRLEAEAKAKAPLPQTINLVGFASDPGCDELRGLLAELGITVNATILPALSPELVDAYPGARLSVLWPNELWQGHYACLRLGSGVPAIEPPAPFGPAATRAWLEAVARALGIDVDVDAVVGRRWQALAGEWERLRQRASRHRLGFVATAEELELLTRAGKTWGIPLLEMTQEMGFAVEVLIRSASGERGAAAESVDAIRASLRGRGAVTPFESRAELGRLLVERGLSAVLSEHFFDRRLVERGLASFCLQHFEPGLGGALRTSRRLLELCELPFYRRYGRHLALAASRRPGVTDSLGRTAEVGSG